MLCFHIRFIRRTLTRCAICRPASIGLCVRLRCGVLCRFFFPHQRQNIFGSFSFVCPDHGGARSETVSARLRFLNRVPISAPCIPADSYRIRFEFLSFYCLNNRVVFFKIKNLSSFQLQTDVYICERLSVEVFKSN